MIALPPHRWFAVFFLAQLALVLAATVYYAAKKYRRRPARHAKPYIFRCARCGHVYLDRRQVPMGECEKCGAMNESVRSL